MEKEWIRKGVREGKNNDGGGEEGIDKESW